MAQRTEQISLHLNAYLTAHSSPPDAVLRELAIETVELFPTEMGLAIAPEQGTLMTLLTQLTGAVSAIEIGTFTGYSSICIARGLAAGGRLLCCDISEEWTSIARRHWEKAGVAGRITLKLAPAIETLRALPGEPHLDLAFVDADKGGYRAYAEELIPRLRTDGLLLVDNVLWSGRVIDSDATDEDTQHIREFNDWLARDQRVETVMLPVADGLTIARKR
jgi:caffeoyl-CoA O-methyltransferase